jgi:hypothetical protein
MEARDERRLLNMQKRLAKLKLLVIDELGFVPETQCTHAISAWWVHKSTEFQPGNIRSSQKRSALPHDGDQQWVLHVAYYEGLVAAG